MPTVEELQDRIAQLEDILGLTADIPVIHRLRHRGLLRTEAKLLGLLLRRPFVPYEAAYDALYGDLPESELPKMESLRTVAKRLRNALSSTGVKISVVYSVGYFIDPADKKKLLAAWPEVKEAA